MGWRVVEIRGEVGKDCCEFGECFLGRRKGATHFQIALHLGGDWKSPARSEVCLGGLARPTGGSGFRVIFSTPQGVSLR
jgi:hypothetical protein